MKKEHKYKKNHDISSEGLSSYKRVCSYSDEYDSVPRKKKKHKSHRYDSDEDSPNRGKTKESSNRVIHIHSSSSEDENKHNDWSRKKHVKDEKYHKHDRHRSKRKEDKDYKKKYKHKLDSSDLEEKNHHYSSKKLRNGMEYNDHEEKPFGSSKHRSSDIHKSHPKEDKRSKFKIHEEEHGHDKVLYKRELNDNKGTKFIKVEPKEETTNVLDRGNPQPRRQRSKSRDIQEWGGSNKEGKGNTGSGEIQKPNFGLSGKLAEQLNVYNGVVIKYSEPPEARMPKKRWRLYQFKGDETLPTLYIHRQSAYLLGRDRRVADIPIDHPSCSKQHAALQYRLVPYNRPDGSVGKRIKLYLIDLESANGTFINNKKIEVKKYVELLEKDVIKFGFSSREYVLLHEHSKDDEDNTEPNS